MDKFTKAFLVALLWSSTLEDGTPLDRDHGIEDIHPDTLNPLKADCAKFQQENAELLSGLDPEQCGHDFALTRGRHGVGFWDRGLGKVGKDLTKASHAYGEVDLYIGGDGQLHSN